MQKPISALSYKQKPGNCCKVKGKQPCGGLSGFERKSYEHTTTKQGTESNRPFICFSL